MAVSIYDAENSVVATSDADPNELVITTIILANNDNIGPGQFFLLKLSRKATSGSDTLTGNANVYAVRVWMDH